MKTKVRVCRRGVIALACGAVLAAPALAQDPPAGYPQRPIRIIVGIAPGGGLDTMTRLAAQKLTERWGQTAVVDNRPGGGTVIGMELAAQAVPDGYTLLSASDTLKLNGVFKRAKFDVRRMFIPVVPLTSQPYMLVLHPSVPAKSVKELIAYAKAKPGALSYGSQGFGTTGHIGWERFVAKTGISVVHVPYKGAAPAVLDLVAGQIHMTFATMVSSGPHVRSGRLRPIAVTGPARSKLFPDLPTVSEAGVPGYTLKNAYAYFAPAGTPMTIVRAINGVVSAGMNSPEVARPITADGSEVAPTTTPEAFKAEFDREYAEIEQTVREAKIELK